MTKYKKLCLLPYIVLLLLTIEANGEIQCDKSPTSISAFFVFSSSGNESTIEQILCDSFFWKWENFQIKFSESKSFASTKKLVEESEANNFTKEEYIELYDKATDESFLPNPALSRSLGISRVYGRKASFISFAGMSFEVLDFTSDNSFQLLEDNTNPDGNKSDVSVQGMSIGANVCAVDYIFPDGGTGFILTDFFVARACYIPSFGYFQSSVVDSDRISHSKEGWKTYDQYKYEVGISVPSSFYISISHSLYNFWDILPDQCGAISCPNPIHIWTESQTVSLYILF